MNINRVERKWWEDALFLQESSINAQSMLVEGCFGDFVLDRSVGFQHHISFNDKETTPLVILFNLYVEIYFFKRNTV